MASAELGPDQKQDILRAWARPACRDELHGLGVHVIPTMGGHTHVIVPPENAAYILARVAELLDDRGAAQPVGDEVSVKGGRPPGSFVETETFWTVWGMVVLDDASARAIAKATDKNHDLEFVNRDKAGVIVKAVKRNRAAARRALGGRETPRGFSATSYGVKLPD